MSPGRNNTFFFFYLDSLDLLLYFKIIFYCGVLSTLNYSLTDDFFLRKFGFLIDFFKEPINIYIHICFLYIHHINNSGFDSRKVLIRKE